MTKRKLIVNLVAVAAALARPRQITRFLKVVDDRRRGSLGYADCRRDVPVPGGWIGGDALEDVCVVRHESPQVVRISCY